MPIPSQPSGFPFPFEPFPPGDPSPEIARILRERLDPVQQTKLAHAMLDTHIKMAEARLSGLQEMRNLAGEINPSA